MKVRLLIDRSQYAGMQWGLMMAGAMFVASLLFPPYGLSLLWALLAVQLAGGGVVCWRRTGLWLISLAMLIGAPSLAIGAVLTVRYGWPPSSAWPAPALALLGSGLVAAVCCGLAEPRVHPQAWAAWARHMAGRNGWDILLYRHIPDLRHGDRVP